METEIDMIQREKATHHQSCAGSRTIEIAISAMTRPFRRPPSPPPEEPMPEPVKGARRLDPLREARGQTRTRASLPADCHGKGNTARLR